MTTPTAAPALDGPPARGAMLGEWIAARGGLLLLGSALFVFLTLPLAMLFVRSFEDGGGAFVGGDTDTNAAIAGALLGAASGIQALPDRWIRPVLTCRPLAEVKAMQPRPMAFWPDDVLDLAEALAGRTT